MKTHTAAPTVFKLNNTNRSFEGRGGSFNRNCDGWVIFPSNPHSLGLDLLSDQLFVRKRLRSAIIDFGCVIGGRWGYGEWRIASMYVYVWLLGWWGSHCTATKQWTGSWLGWDSGTGTLAGTPTRCCPGKYNSKRANCNSDPITMTIGICKHKSNNKWSEWIHTDMCGSHSYDPFRVTRSHLLTDSTICIYTRWTSALPIPRLLEVVIFACGSRVAVVNGLKYGNMEGMCDSN